MRVIQHDILLSYLKPSDKQQAFIIFQLEFSQNCPSSVDLLPNVATRPVRAKSFDEFRAWILDGMLDASGCRLTSARLN